MGINKGNLAMAEEIHRREAERLGRGLSQELDVARARSNVQQRRSVLLKSREEYLVAMDRLKLLLNWEKFNLDSDDTVVPVEPPQIEPLVVNADEAIATALANRSEILKVKQEQMIRQADETLAAHQRLPTLDAYGRYSVSGYGRDFEDAREDISINDEDAWEVGINFEWPIGNRAANARYRKKVLERRQVEALMKRIEDDIKLDVKQILHSITTARGEIEAARLARDAAAKVVEGEFTRFDIGQTSNVELLRAQDLLALTNRSYTRAVVNYNIALHELERAQGVLPRGVTIEKNPR
jgi:outer membrane protein TolC